MPLTIHQVDAFTDTLFAGNPAAVCILPAARDETWMQHVAREMNLSETAFLVKTDDGYDLRWFTPVHEVDLCGHATLASAHILYETGVLARSAEARFHTKSGRLTARRDGDWIVMDFPATPVKPTDQLDALNQGLGVTPKFTGRSKFDYLLELDSERTVRRLQPDMSKLGEIVTRGIIVTAKSDSRDYDFVSRFFAPRSGIDEDPVTGSSHCALGPFWNGKLGKDHLIAKQVSARTGIVRVTIKGERVLLGGQAVTVMRGGLLSV